eukprot:m.311940 g.311940  ORF g.311940 m.311940 type:complete len:382 (+) comp28848_c0_seq1:265-1410(+)
MAGVAAAVDSPWATPVRSRRPLTPLLNLPVDDARRHSIEPMRTCASPDFLNLSSRSLFVGHQSCSPSPLRGHKPSPLRRTSAKRHEQLLRIRKIGSRADAIVSILDCAFSEEISRQFELVRLLGRGAFGTVVLVRDRATGELAALKAIQKHRLKNPELLDLEVTALKRASHPFVTKLVATSEDDAYRYLVLEYCQGGELLDKLIDEGHLGEREASCIIRQILTGLHNLHARGILHRDLKPDNILLVDRDNVFQGVRISDFGVAHLFPDNSRTVTYDGNYGTLEYLSPEILRGENYGCPSDVWAVGVILFNLLSGDYPWSSGSEAELAKLILEAKLDLSHPGWSIVSSDAKDLLCSLLEPDVAKRMTVEKALRHPWVALTSL